MSVGSGIFLAGLCVALVALYALTRDRWRWRRIVTRGAVALVSLVVVGSGAVVGYQFFESKPKVVVALNGVALGESRQDVVFKHGAGTLAKRFDLKVLENYLASDAAKRDAAYTDLVRAAYKEAGDLAALGQKNLLDNAAYEFDDKEVQFKGGRVFTIAHMCSTSDIDATVVNGVRCGQTGDVLRDKFGAELRVLCSAETGASAAEERAFDVVALGTRFYLRRNAVFGFMVAKSEDLATFTKKNWIPCP